jgi:hypothetical protein
VPKRLAGAAPCGPLIQATTDAALLEVPQLARFLVGGDGAVVVERAAGTTDADLRCCLDEPVAALAAQLRGDLVLRASAVSIDGRAVAICGAPVAGKSALAAALAQRGHAVLADAVTCIAGGSDGGPALVTRTDADPQLWPDSVSELGLTHSDGRQVRPELAKRAYTLGSSAERAPLLAVVDLQVNANCDGPAVEPLGGGVRVHTLMARRWHGRLAAPLGLEPAQFALAAHAAAGATCVRLERPLRGAPVAELATLVEGLFA